jgi:hypothetical protein
MGLATNLGGCYSTKIASRCLAGDGFRASRHTFGILKKNNRMSLNQLSDILADACDTKKRYDAINQGVCIFITTNQGTDKEITFRLGITNLSGPGHKSRPFEQAQNLVAAIKSGTHCTATYKTTRLKIKS